MSVFSKILESLGKTISKELDKHASKEAGKNLAKPSKNPHKQRQIHKEQRGIYNVTYNGKNATTIHKDLEKIDEVIAYTKGNRNKGARHIHLEHSQDSSQQGFVTPDEIANLGQNIREYIKTHGQPFSDTNKARVYEWKDDEGNSFRAVVNDMPKKEASGYNSNLPAASKNASGGNSLLPSASEEIITFYSDRNLKNKMNFKNPALNQSKNTDSTLQSTSLTNDKLPPKTPPMMRE